MRHFVTEMCTFLLQNGASWVMGLVHGIWERCIAGFVQRAYCNNDAQKNSGTNCNNDDYQNENYINRINKTTICKIRTVIIWTATTITIKIVPAIITMEIKFEEHVVLIQQSISQWHLVLVWHLVYFSINTAFYGCSISHYKDMMVVKICYIFTMGIPTGKRASWYNTLVSDAEKYAKLLLRYF